MSYNERVRRFAAVVGGEVIDLGHAGMVVGWSRPDGQFVAAGVDVIACYADRAAFDRGDGPMETMDLADVDF
jgi:hypothetical protein